MEKQPMDIGFAVFNCHVNNAKSKAIRRFKKKHGAEVFKEQIQPFLKNGIMTIFHQEPNEYTKEFAETIQQIVNE